MTWTAKARAEWLEENAERRKAYCAEWRRANRARINELSRLARKRASDADPKAYWLARQAVEVSRRAKKKNIPYQDLSGIVLPDVCPVLGLTLDYRRWQGRTGWNPSSPSIDRIVPAKGYVPGNVRVISNRANTLKRDGTIEELRRVLAYMEAPDVFS